MNSTPLSLTIKYTQIREVICSQGWGLFLPLVGQWSWLCTHILPVFPISSNSLCLVGETLADSTPYLFLFLSSLVSVSFLKTLFRVVFLHKSQSHTGVGKTSFWKQWRDAGILLVFMSLHVWHIFSIPHSIFRSTLNSYIQGEQNDPTAHTGSITLANYLSLDTKRVTFPIVVYGN